jgi:hypothetical protein
MKFRKRKDKNFAYDSCILFFKIKIDVPRRLFVTALQ